MRRTFWLIFCLVCLVSCVSGQDYLDPEGPVYEGDYAAPADTFDGILKVVTWNLKFAENPDEAIAVLAQVEELRDADVLLLQEMDQVSVDAIARELDFNYVYYPATIHPHHEKNYGTAILTKWSIVNHSKIPLPNSVSRVKQLRIAMMAEIQVEESLLDVYNTHLEISWMLARNGRTQADYLFSQIDPHADWTIVGGDFNSWSPGSIGYLEDMSVKAGISRVTAGTGHTFDYRGLRLTLDHLFSSGVRNVESGVWRGTDASDHYPVWARIDLNRN
jgi:endonuclease/exonuclease/phosphatase family metal-dependent hydrolase